MTVKEAVVARFAEILKERNMRLNELANVSGITPSTVYSMMDSKRKEYKAFHRFSSQIPT